MVDVHTGTRWGGLAIAVIALLWSVFYLYHDFRSFLALGPGGTPATLGGYIRIKILSLFALRNPYAAGRVPKEAWERGGYLDSLPLRGTRPITRGIAPHRQVDQKAGEGLYQQLANGISKLGMQRNRLVLGTSCFEKHGTGLFSMWPAKKTCKGEVCHVHPSDGSLHMTLHPVDAKIVLESKWGERHPLARGGWLERFVPCGFIMVYAPLTEEDVETVLEVVKAAVWYVDGGGDGSAEGSRELVASATGRHATGRGFGEEE